MKLLLTAIGKRVQLIKYFKKYFQVVGADCSKLAPAVHFVDKFYLVSPYHQDLYKSEILNICKEEKIDIMIPLYEPEFFVLDSIRDKLRECGTFLLIPNHDVLNICSDKWNTYEFFSKNDINTPLSFKTIDECDVSFPLFIKPRQGMGSFMANKVNNIDELNFYSNRIKTPLIQEFIEGIEYTVDCICDLDGKPVSIVPRERLEIRSGEVSKTRTVKDENIVILTKNICDKLGAIGPVTIQCIKTPQNEVKFTEINPRLGGGVPLSFAAGIDYGQIFKDMIIGKKIKPLIGEFKELTMLRYDDAIFI